MKRLAPLLVLLSLLLSPLAMQPAAAAQPHQAMAASMGGHCGEPSPTHGKVKLGDCAMACASALPAVDLPAVAEANRILGTVEPTRLPILSGLSPESETPPPRSA